MPNDTVVLEKFWFEELAIQWRPIPMDEGQGRPSVPMELLLSYETQPLPRSPERARMVMTLSTASETQARVGYEIHAKAVGMFAIAQDSSAGGDAEAGRTFQIQAVTILYGILQRQVAEATETFPGRALKLPEISAELLVDRLGSQNPPATHFTSEANGSAKPPTPDAGGEGAP